MLESISPGTDAAEAVLRFLESVGRRSEAEYYVRLFQAQSRGRFAAVVVDSVVARHALEAVVVDLKFLSQLGLWPVVVLGVYEPAHAEAHAQALADRLALEHVPAVVGPLHEIRAAHEHTHVIPIIPFTAQDGANFPARVDQLGTLLAQFATQKLILLQRRGGLHIDGTRIPVVNLEKDLRALLVSTELSRKQRAWVEESRRLIQNLVSHRLLVSIASPLELLRELFTVQGAGTLIRRGAVVHHHTNYDGLDLPQLTRLLESSFGRTVQPDFFERAVSHIYLEEHYRGVAITAATNLGAYLTKFAVDQEAQGEGVGRDLWDELVRTEPRVFWRSRPDNPINEWYLRQCDGFLKLQVWTVFWRGLSPEEIPPAIAFAERQPRDLTP